ncbi:MAG: hypothetical protein ACI86X_001005 [Moritella sp.]|jgi:hypothetical protein
MNRKLVTYGFISAVLMNISGVLLMLFFMRVCVIQRSTEQEIPKQA